MDATVTMCHSKTADLPAVIGAADIVVAALGRPLFVQGSWLKPGAVVIDVGINAVDDATKKSGHRLVGDVDFESAEKGMSASLSLCISLHTVLDCTHCCLTLRLACLLLPLVASLITPVPGGVGPMTVAMLMENTVSAFYVQHARAVIAHVTAAAATDEAAVAAAVAAAAGADAGAWPVTAAALVALYGKGPLPQGLVKAVLHQLGLDANKKEDAELFVRKFRK
jgi:methylenetetrahydrofolate dehydrogenase (NADP+)/methenyltetrahydrofolate cyclohydrolase/formyltetrahydrofolate synthetase